MPEALLQSHPKQRVRGRPFVKGQSGNPAGRPRRSKNRNTLAARELLDGEAEALTRKALDMAMNGDAGAMRLCLERVMAPRRESAVHLDLPPIRDAGDVAGAMAAVVAAVARGGVTPGEGGTLGRLLDTYIRAIEATDFERRLRRVEANPYPPTHGRPYRAGLGG
jgi:hypothetical protein